MGTEIWILGGTGRSGRAVAAELLSRGLSPVLVGRDAARLDNAAANLAAPARTVVAASIEDTAAEIQRQQPAVVINTVGPFTTTAGPIVRACLPSSHYVDLANDLPAVVAVLGLGQQATAAGKHPGHRGRVRRDRHRERRRPAEPASSAPTTTRPPRSGWTWCPRWPWRPASSARPWPEPSSTASPTPAAGAGTEGRRYKNGRLIKARLAGDPAALTLPDGIERHHREHAARRAHRGPAGQRRAQRDLRVQRGHRPRRSSARFCPWPPRCWPSGRSARSPGAGWPA